MQLYFQQIDHFSYYSNFYPAVFSAGTNIGVEHVNYSGNKMVLLMMCCVWSSRNARSSMSLVISVICGKLHMYRPEQMMDRAAQHAGTQCDKV